MADTLMIGIRFALFADLMLVMGMAAFPLYTLRRGENDEARVAAELATAQPWLCGFGLFTSLAGMLVLTASMQGVAIGDLDMNMLATMAIDADVGKAWIVRTLTLVVALPVAVLWRARYPFAVAAFLSASGAITLASLVWSGHAAASEGLAGTAHRLADALHLIAAGVWIGAIAAFLILLRPTTSDPQPVRLALAARSLDRFARVGTTCVAVLAATGLINVEMIVGIAQAGQMFDSPYGYLLGAKLILFGLMLGLAALNRWRLTPALAGISGGAPTRAIRRSLLLEAGAATAILALVSLLGMLEP